MTILHFVTVLGFAPLIRNFPSRWRGSERVHITYDGGRGLLRQWANLLGAVDGVSVIERLDEEAG